MGYLTLEQAENNWGIKSNTIMKYVAEGMIAGISTDNNIILFPTIKRPHYLGKKVFDVYKEIVRATKNKEHIDYLLTYQSVAEFSAIMKALIDAECLINVSNDDDFSTNIGIIIGIKGEEFLKKHGRKIIIDSNVNCTLNNQIGLINIGG